MVDATLRANMQEALVNGEILISVPDGFDVMDDSLMDDLYEDHNHDRWGIIDRENHMVLTVFWHMPNGLLLKMVPTKTICKSTEERLSARLKDHDYKFEKHFRRLLCNIEGEGFRHSYSIRGYQYIAEIIVFKQGNVCYTVYAYSRTEMEPVNRPQLNDILESMKIKD
jgi:hypothetical protein